MACVCELPIYELHACKCSHTRIGDCDVHILKPHAAYLSFVIRKFTDR